MSTPPATHGSDRTPRTDRTYEVTALGLLVFAFVGMWQTLSAWGDWSTVMPWALLAVAAVGFAADIFRRGRARERR